ncbi:hypothetical protein [Massilia sp. Se16.2.3]|uniref:hypothetical protein n=1 Tax=Massilia sp. Se16.2.3 TaxID=2709303 RepID=UPI001E62979B|nr:hypothetical protein [Massilia sp. Se16.2.3]
MEALGGTGAITGNNAAGSAINGNVRNPATLDYFNRGSLDPASGFTRTFPGAACANFTSHPQGDPGGGCLIDSTLAYNQIQPEQENYSLFGRGTWRITPAIEGYAELNLYSSQSSSSTTPSTVSANVGYPGGPVSNAGVRLGPNHPDNPYFGTAARLRYLVRRRRPARLEHRRLLRTCAGRSQGKRRRLGVRHFSPVLAQHRLQRTLWPTAARRRFRPARPQCRQHRGGAGHQSGLRRAADR